MLEVKTLVERAVSAKSWRWAPLLRVRSVEGRPVGAIYGIVHDVYQGVPMIGNPDHPVIALDPLPDANDPSFFGHVFMLVQEHWGACELFYEHETWCCVYRRLEPKSRRIWYGATALEALICALEDATP